MSKNLIKVKLSDIAEITMGQSPKGNDCNTSAIGTPLLNGPTEFTDFYPSPVQYTTDGKKYCTKNDILFCVRGSTTGRMNWADQVYAIGRGLASISYKKNNNCNRFLKYLIEYNLPSLLSSTNGSTFPNLTGEMIASFELFVPSTGILEINELFENLDSKIELNNRINGELEQMAKLLYDYWFVQFDFPANLQDRSLSGAEGYKSSGGKMVYSKELKREIPEGWEAANLASWILKDKSGDWGKETMQGNYTEQVSCIRGADLNGLKGQGVLKSPTRYTLEKNAHKQLESHDLIVEISGGSPTQSTGRLAYLIDETLERFQNPLICSNFCKAVTLKEEKQLYYFAQTWQMLYDNDALFCWEGKTSGIKNLLFDGFVNSYKVPVPNNELVEKFYKTVHSFEIKKQANLKENQNLTQLRDWLLPMLMNGQVSIKQAQEKIAESLKIAAEPNTSYGKK